MNEGISRFWQRLTLGVRHQEVRMTESFQVLLSELERFGEANDNATAERPRRMLNITRDTGEFPEQMAPFVALVTADTDFTTSLVPIGNGEFLAVKAAR